MDRTIVRSGLVAPRLISSRGTFLQKKVLPVILFGFLGLFMLIAATANPSPHSPPRALFLIHPLLMSGFAYLIMRKFVFDLVDEVWDHGDSLLVKNKGYEVRVMLADIINVGHTILVNPPRVTLSLRQPTPLGEEIAFMPPHRWLPFARSPIVDELIRRVDAARTQARR